MPDARVGDGDLARARPRGRAATVTSPPDGVNRTALSSRLNSTWCTRSRVGDRPAAGLGRPRARTRTSRSGAADLDLGDHPVDERRQRTSARASSGTSPDSSFGQVEQLLDQARRAARSARASPAGSRGRAAPRRRARFSRWARIAVIGVFSSCETLATRSRRSRSRCSSSAAHPVERRRELPDLVAAARLDPRRVVARPPSGEPRRPCRAAAGSCRAPAIARGAVRPAPRRAPAEQELPPHALQEPERRRDAAEGASRRARAA